MTTFAHGIISVDPPIIECDGCGYRYTTTRGLAFAVLFSGIEFNPAIRGDDRRLCRECRIKDGWTVEW